MKILPSNYRAWTKKKESSVSGIFAFTVVGRRGFEGGGGLGLWVLGLWVYVNERKGKGREGVGA